MLIEQKPRTEMPAVIIIYNTKMINKINVKVKIYIIITTNIVTKLQITRV